MGDAELVDEGAVAMSAGERLRAAREAAGLTLEDIATSTRIPTRHLESLEAGDFARLPAPTYTIGFAKNYAAAVGLDRTEIGDQLRAEMGGTRPASTTPDVFEPADPARAMPKWLIVGAIGGILLVALLFNWLNSRALEEPDEVAATNEVGAVPQAPAEPPVQPQGAVVLTATDRVWIEVKDGAVILKQGELAPGETFAVPPNAVAPTLTTAKPEALRIAVGTAVAPPIGEPARKVTVSLKPDDLLRPQAATAAVGPQAAPTTPATPTRTAPARRATTRPTRPATQPEAPPPAPEPQANTTNTATPPQQ